MRDAQKSKLKVMFFMTVITAVMMVSASYAWLGISRIPFVSDIDLSIFTENKLLIAPDIEGVPGEWSTSLDLSAIMEDMVPLKPVTYDHGVFMKVNYGTDGRPAGVSPINPENVNVVYPDENRDSVASYQAEVNGWMIAIDYWMKATEGSYGDVILTESTTTVDGLRGPGTYVVGNPIWNTTTISHDNGGHGVETSIRIAFECTPTDEQGNPVGETVFTIYEPNADVHADGTTGYVETMSVSGGSLISSDRLAVQTSSTWREQTPVLMDSVIYEMGTFTSKPNLFHIGKEAMTKVTMYIWMEGQDIDCSNRVMAETSEIAANIQFEVINTSSSPDTGIVPR